MKATLKIRNRATDNLDGKVAVVTGASRGIGRAIARRLSREGCYVYLTANDPEDLLAEAADECGGAYGLFDLAEQGMAERMVASALDRYGQIDILVNNAGIRVFRPFGEFTAEDFDRVVAVNLRAAFFASQAVLPAMRKMGRGRIVHTASQLAIMPSRGGALYALTKAALVNLAKAMAIELSPEGITVNTISPGPTNTEFFQEQMKADPEWRELRLSSIPAGRFGTPEEMASAVAYLVSPDAAFVQGSNLIVDGAYVVDGGSYWHR